jgi:hypothetical protein
LKLANVLGFQYSSIRTYPACRNLDDVGTINKQVSCSHSAGQESGYYKSNEHLQQLLNESGIGKRVYENERMEIDSSDRRDMQIICMKLRFDRRKST